MREQCPKCNFRFGWRGPRIERTNASWNLRARQRQVCPSCGAELFDTRLRIERYVLFIGYLSLGMGGLGNTWKAIKSTDLMPIWGVAAFYGISAFAFLLFVLVVVFRKRHYVLTRPGNSVDALPRP
jgi:hypothetical protein